MRLQRWTPRSISGFVWLLLGLFGVLPIALGAMVFFFEANLGMYRASMRIRAIEQETLMKDIQSNARLRVVEVRHHLEDLVRSLGRVALLTKRALVDPENFIGLNKFPLMPA